MRFKSQAVLAAGCICLLGLSVPALGLPKPKGADKHPQPAQLSHNAKVPQNKKSKIVQRVLKVHANARRAREERAARLVSMPIAETPKRPILGWPVLVSEARKYLGTNPTSRSRLWCATFMNMVLAKVGYSGTNSDAAKSFAQYGHRVSEPRVGAIAVLTRGKNGGHVGVVSGIDPEGNPIIISGNHGHRVGEAVYPRSRVIAYVMPSGERGEPATQVAARSQPAEPRAPSDGGIESPITELIAAIEAEQKRDERPVRVAGQSRRADPEPVQRPMPRAGTLPLDPKLAALLGIDAPTRKRVQPPAAVQAQAVMPQGQAAMARQPMPQPRPPALVPVRQRQVQQAPVSASRVATALPAGAFGLR